MDYAGESATAYRYAAQLAAEGKTRRAASVAAEGRRLDRIARVHAAHAAHGARSCACAALAASYAQYATPSDAAHVRISAVLAGVAQ